VLSSAAVACKQTRFPPDSKLTEMQFDRWWGRGERCQLRKEHNARTMVGLWRNLAGNRRPFSDVIADLDRWTTSPPSLFPACRSAAAMSDFDLFGILCLYYLPSLLWGSEKEIAIVYSCLLPAPTQIMDTLCFPFFLLVQPTKFLMIFLLGGVKRSLQWIHEPRVLQTIGPTRLTSSFKNLAQFLLRQIVTKCTHLSWAWPTITTPSPSSFLLKRSPRLCRRPCHLPPPHVARIAPSVPRYPTLHDHSPQPAPTFL
jgi:hypothetical protein